MVSKINAYVLELSERAVEFDKIKQIDEATKQMIAGTLDELALHLQHMHLTEDEYYVLLQSIIERRHAKGVALESAYYYFYKAAGVQIVHTQGGNGKVKNNATPEVPNGIQAPEENTPEENVLEENVLEEGMPEENVLEENVLEENVLEEGMPEEKISLSKKVPSKKPPVASRKKTAGVDPLKKRIIHPGVLALADHWSKDKNEISKVYEKSEYDAVFAVIEQLHNEYIHSFSKIDQNVIKGLYTHYITCKNDKPIEIRVYLQNNHINLYREIRDLLSTVSEEI